MRDRTTGTEARIAMGGILPFNVQDILEEMKYRSIHPEDETRLVVQFVGDSKEYDVISIVTRDDKMKLVIEP